MSIRDHRPSPFASLLAIGLLGSACSSSVSGSNDTAADHDGVSGGDSTSGGDQQQTNNDDPSGGDSVGASCLGGSLLESLGRTQVMVGGSMDDATASSAPINVRYKYLSGGLFDSDTACSSCTSCTANGHTCANSNGEGGCAWWGCYQYDMDPPGRYATDMITSAKEASPAYVPMFTYYEILHASHASEGADEVAAANDQSLMKRYFADWRFLLQRIGNDVAFLHIEPDFWGYAEQSGNDAHAIPSAVNTANPTDCADFENSIAGLGRCMIAMVRTYAPNAKVGLHASAWGANVDPLYNTDPQMDIAAAARKVATFLADCGEGDADFVVIEASDRDAGYYESIDRNAWWDATNTTLPNFHQALAWATTLTETLDKPAIDWQLPLGNATMNNTTNHWQDNRVDYFFAHMDEVAAAHIVALAFGSGETQQTTPESDGGNFVAKVKAYHDAGGQALCQ